MQSQRAIFDFRFSLFDFFAASLALLILGCAISSHATTADNPYQAIVDRNVFALKPPPPPVKVDPEANKPPPPPITLTGITTILGNKRAFLSVNMPAKPPEPAKVQSFMLSEGQRDGDIEVMEIDEKLGIVKVSEFGTVTNLSWEKNGAKMAGGQPAPAAVGGVPPPSANPFAPAGAAGFNKAIPSRTLRLPGVPQSGGGQSPGASADPATTGATPAPVYGGTVSPNSTGLTTISGQPVPSERSPEEAALLYEANRMKNEQLAKQGVLVPQLPQHVLLRGMDNNPAPQQPQNPVQQQRPWNPFAPPGGQAAQ